MPGWFANLFLCRPPCPVECEAYSSGVNGKGKIFILCVLCGSAMNYYDSGFRRNDDWGLHIRTEGIITAAAISDIYFKIVTNPSCVRSKIRLRRKDSSLLELVPYIHFHPVKFPGGNPI